MFIIKNLDLLSGIISVLCT